MDSARLCMCREDIRRPQCGHAHRRFVLALVAAAPPGSSCSKACLCLCARGNTANGSGWRPPEQAEIARSFAYNQGFYNLFLAAGVALGVGADRGR